MLLMQEISEIYDLVPLECKLLRHNENKVYLLKDKQKKYVLRIHQTVNTMNLTVVLGELDDEKRIQSELLLLEGLGKKITFLQKPVRTKAGALVACLGGGYATILEWLEGECLSPETVAEQTVCQIGELLTSLHCNLRTLPRLYRYDYTYPLYENVKKRLLSDQLHKHITAEQNAMMLQIAELYKKTLDKYSKRIQLLHADLGCSNFIQAATEIGVIDFSLAGYGLVEFDLASVLLHFESLCDTEILLRQYEKTQAFDKECVQLCMAMQVVMFVVSAYESISEMPWFEGLLDFWCEGLFSATVNGEPWTEKVQLYQA